MSLVSFQIPTELPAFGLGFLLGRGKLFLRFFFVMQLRAAIIATVVDEDEDCDAFSSDFFDQRNISVHLSRFFIFAAKFFL